MSQEEAKKRNEENLLQIFRDYKICDDKWKAYNKAIKDNDIDITHHQPISINNLAEKLAEQYDVFRKVSANHPHADKNKLLEQMKSNMSNPIMTFEKSYSLTNIVSPNDLAETLFANFMDNDEQIAKYIVELRTCLYEKYAELVAVAKQELKVHEHNAKKYENAKLLFGDGVNLTAKDFITGLIKD